MGRAAFQPMTPKDQIIVAAPTSPNASRNCLVKFEDDKSFKFAGTAKAFGDSQLPPHAFFARVSWTGDGTSLRLVGVEEKRICKICKKPLRAIGWARKNGKPHKDWMTREEHKKCFKDRVGGA
eukprot:2525714-Prymnesium_polylepis.1